MPTIDLKDITGGFRVSDINSNFTKIEEAINDKVLKYDSTVDTSSNNMETELDMDTNKIINLEDATEDADAVNLRVLKEYVKLGITLQRRALELTEGQTEVPTSQTIDEINSATVYYNGLRQEKGRGYTIIDAGISINIVLNEPGEAGDRVSWEFFGE